MLGKRPEEGSKSAPYSPAEMGDAIEFAEKGVLGTQRKIEVYGLDLLDKKKFPPSLMNVSVQGTQAQQMSLMKKEDFSKNFGKGKDLY